MILQKKRFLIADMCYHQVMVECMYHIFSRIRKTQILANESVMAWPKDIPLQDIIPAYKPKGKTTAFSRRFYRFLFLIHLLLIKNRYSHIIVTAGIEYSPKGVRTLSYLIYYLLCSSRTHITTVVHNTVFWEKNNTRSFLKRIFISGILKKSTIFACLSEKVLKRWQSRNLTKKTGIRLPFLTVAQKDIHIQKAKLVDGKFVLAFQGLVNHKRKNYSEMAKAFDCIAPEKKKMYKVIFQGPPVYPEDRKFLETFSKIIECDWRNYFLPYDKMSNLLKHAHLFICPLNLSYYGYGNYKESGVGFDCIRYQKGAITKRNVCSEEFNDILFTYETTDELSSILNNLTLEKVTEINKNVYDTSQQFTHSYWAQQMSTVTNHK